MWLEGLRRGITVTWAECTYLVYDIPLYTCWAESHHIFGGRFVLYHWYLTWTAHINQQLYAQLQSWWCHMIGQDYAQCLGLIIMPPLIITCQQRSLRRQIPGLGFLEECQTFQGSLGSPYCLAQMHRALTCYWLLKNTLVLHSGFNVIMQY